MIRNYIKIAWRNLLNFKSYGLINLFGLMVGTVCCLAIIFYVQSQFGYEKHFKDYGQIYKVTTQINHTETPTFKAVTASPAMGPALLKDFDEILQQTRVVSFTLGGDNDLLMKPEASNLSFFEGGGYLADSTFFDVFNFSFLQGKPSGALDNPNSIILSSALAKKLFGTNESVLGKEVHISKSGDDFSAQVTGVIDENEGKTHLKANFIISMASTGLGQFVLSSNYLATNNFIHTYIKVNPHTKIETLASKLPAFLEKNAGEQLRHTNMDKELGLVKIEDINLKTSDLSFQLGKTSDIKYLYLLLGIAFFIQLMACINYINLTTAQATRRAKEIGVRKVNGAASKALLYQFLSESILFSLLAVLLSIPLLLLLLPYINNLLDASLQFSDIFSVNMLLITLAIGLITGLISGAYPAFFLSMMNPVKILKQSFKTGKRAFLLRNGLVVFQFSMVFLLIYSVSVISKQINHLNTSDLGFTKEQKLIIPLKTNEAQSSYDVLESELSNLAQVGMVTGSVFYPSQDILYDQKFYIKGQSVNDGQIIKLNLAQENFFETMGIEMLVGKQLTPTDGLEMIVNEAFLKTYGLTLENAIGTQFFNQDSDPDDEAMQVVGVIKDYNFTSLKNEIVPIATFYGSEVSNLIISYNGENTSELLSEIETKWQTHNSNTPFEYNFLDDRMASIYASELRLKKVSYTFAFLAILISLLGIWGLVSFTTQQRTKEIGVRKVLGASVAEITRLLSKEFVVLVGLAVLIGAPLGIYMMRSWLDSYAYKIDNIIPLLAFAAVCTLAVCLLTVIYKTLIAARANPIQSIKSE